MLQVGGTENSYGEEEEGAEEPHPLPWGYLR